jgi:hypothetical protein
MKASQFNSQKFHLDLLNSNFKSNNIQDLEPLLSEWLKSENEPTFNKTQIIEAKDLNNYKHLDIYLENIDDKFYYQNCDGNNIEVKNVHYYNEWTYIIETI